MEAELKRQKVEEEIQRIAQYEAEKRQVAEAQAAHQIKEQANRLEKQASKAQQKADQARLLAESEVQKREWAEMAKIKAEEEARRLAEEIIQAQRRLKEAQQLAKSESKKRVLEEAARTKAEELARSSSLENRQNVESLKITYTFHCVISLFLSIIFRKIILLIFWRLHNFLIKTQV